MRVLIVEDMPESLAMLRELADAAFPGSQCLEAVDVRTALGQLVIPFQLALVDLSLPDGSGSAVIEALSRDQPECTIVVATIFDDDDHLFGALRAGAHGYLLKDEPLENLIDQLNGIRDGRPPLSPSIARRILEHFRAPQPAAPAAVALTAREREVLGHLAQGVSLAEIGRRLGISPYTVGDHVKSIYRKLNISSRAEAALQAKNLGLL